MLPGDNNCTVSLYNVMRHNRAQSSIPIRLRAEPESNEKFNLINDCRKREFIQALSLYFPMANGFRGSKLRILVFTRFTPNSISAMSISWQLPTEVVTTNGNVWTLSCVMNAIHSYRQDTLPLVTVGGDLKNTGICLHQGHHL